MHLRKCLYLQLVFWSNVKKSFSWSFSLFKKKYDRVLEQEIKLMYIGINLFIFIQNENQTFNDRNLVTVFTIPRKINATP